MNAEEKGRGSPGKGTRRMKARVNWGFTTGPALSFFRNLELCFPVGGASALRTDLGELGCEERRCGQDPMPEDTYQSGKWAAVVTRPRLTKSRVLSSGRSISDTKVAQSEAPTAPSSPSKGRNKMCEHGKRLYACRQCGGAGICEHGKRKYTCKECGGKGLCEHGKRKGKCKECLAAPSVEASIEGGVGGRSAIPSLT